MANIMNMVKLNNKPKRNGFDLSKKNAFTAKVGELLPIYCKEVLPGDKFRINPKWMTRTQPVNTAAYTRIREYMDFVFVPTNLLWKNFNVFVTNMLQQTYSATSPDTTNILQDKQPYFTVTDICSYLQKSYADGEVNFFGYNRAKLTAKLLHYLGYGDYSTSIDPMDSDFKLPRTNAELNPFPLLAYQKACDDFFRNSQWQTARPNIYNVDYLDGTDLHVPVDELTYNNESVYNMFDMQYCNWNKDYFMGLLPSSQYGDAASVDLGSLEQEFNVSEKDNQAWNSFNMSFTVNDNFTSTGGSGLTKLFSFVDDGSLIKKSYVDSNGDIVQTDSWLDVSLPKGRLQFLAQQIYSNMSISSNLSGTNAFTVLALRQAEAKQKWAEITQSNAQDYRSQVKAHFGKNVSSALSMRSDYIGGMSSSIDISEVVNQNLGAEGAEANIQGKGVGVGQGKISYEVPVHGYIIGIYHAVPLLDYSMTGIKRQNLKTTFMDYAIPEFDQTGMVKVPVIELTNSQFDTVTVEDDYHLGYAPRYVDYKTDIDEVHGAFYNGGLQHWVAPFDDSYIKTFFESFYQNSFYGLVWPFMKVNPAVVNPIFAVNADSDVSTDQLLVNCYFDVKAVRNLDVNGLPY